MNTGLSLVEFLLSMTIASILVLALLTINSLGAKTCLEARDSWYCMQSLRNTIMQLDTDLMQCGYLLPPDLRIVPGSDRLFIAGTAVTQAHSGLILPKKSPPPFFSVVRSVNDYSIILDTVDIDGSTSPDFWAGMGIISESGGFAIAQTYSRGSISIPLTGRAALSPGQRVVPAIHYELRTDGLYRNSQLIAEAIRAFDTAEDGNAVKISLEAGYHEISKKITYLYTLR